MHNQYDSHTIKKSGHNHKIAAEELAEGCIELEKRIVIFCNPIAILKSHQNHAIAAEETAEGCIELVWCVIIIIIVHYYLGPPFVLCQDFTPFRLCKKVLVAEYKYKYIIQKPTISHIDSKRKSISTLIYTIHLDQIAMHCEQKATTMTKNAIKFHMRFREACKNYLADFFR